MFEGEHDDDEVYFRQAYNDTIAYYALIMTWIKPSFAWVLYRSKYGTKHNQTLVLKVKLSHESVSKLLSECKCKHGGGRSKGRVQYDPARNLMASVDGGKTQRKMLRRTGRDQGRMSAFYVMSILQIEDVTILAQRVQESHTVVDTGTFAEELLAELPVECPYMPHCERKVLVRLGCCLVRLQTMSLARIGFGKTFPSVRL